METKFGMTRRGFVALAAMAAAAAAFAPVATKVARADAATRTFVDDAGREHAVPLGEDVTSIYFTSPISEIYCFTLAPDLGVGTTFDPFAEEELKYLPAGYGDLPTLGSLASGGELNPEAIIAANPQFIVSISQSGKISESDIDTADDIQDKTGIPCILFKGGMDDVAELYRRLGELLGREEDAAVLSAYCEKALSDVRAAVESIPADERVTLYYAEGPEGLETEPETSPHALTFKIAGAKNVADVEGGNRAAVSLEQVLAWDPEVIIAWSTAVRGGASDVIPADPDWAEISAVKNGRVYAMPNTPFSWCDRPPSVNRFLGIQWVANTLYPEAYDVDMVEVTKEFYKLFYHVDIPDDEVLALLGSSYVAPADGAAGAQDDKEAPAKEDKPKA